MEFSVQNEVFSLEILAFSAVDKQLLYDVMTARQRVFILEQQCAFIDADAFDFVSDHLFVWKGPFYDRKEIAAYMRILAPDSAYPGYSSIGRVMTDAAYRGRNLGKISFEHGMDFCLKKYPQFPMKIQAQLYLQKFYESFDFYPVSKVYLDTGIWHIDMVYDKHLAKA